MTRAEMIALLRTSSPKARLDDVTIYVDALIEYRIAQENIKSVGSIVAHPRTAAPIPNPYLAVKAANLKILATSGKRLNVAELWSDDE